MARRPRRPEALVIATKVGMAGWARAAQGAHPRNILRGAEESLRRLQVERIDLYYAHEDDPGTAIEETMRAFDELVGQGLVRSGRCLELPGRAPLTEALRIGDVQDLVRFRGLQAAEDPRLRRLQGQLEHPASPRTWRGQLTTPSRAPPQRTRPRRRPCPEPVNIGQAVYTSDCAWLSCKTL